MMPLKPGEPMAPSPGSILAVGEVLLDALPEGISLGGAPFNVMCHLNALGQPAKMISRIGDDELGREITHQFQQRGLSSDLLQRDDSLPTGFVRVALTDRGSPSYDILQPAAWDEIECTQDLLTIAALLHGLLRGDDLRDTLDHANALGAFVATQRGATPAHDRDAIDQFHNSNAP